MCNPLTPNITGCRIDITARVSPSCPGWRVSCLEISSQHNTSQCSAVSASARHRTHLLHTENTNESCSENTEPTDLSTLFWGKMMMIVVMWMWKVQESMYSYNVVFKYFKNDRWKDVFLLYDLRGQCSETFYSFPSLSFLPSFATWFQFVYNFIHFKNINFWLSY